jgi:hypothetical protein
MFVCLFSLCFPVCRQRPCDGLISHLDRLTYCVKIETENLAKAQQSDVGPLVIIIIIIIIITITIIIIEKRKVTLRVIAHLRRARIQTLFRIVFLRHRSRSLYEIKGY